MKAFLPFGALLLFGLLPSPLLAQKAENFPVSVNDLPLLLDLTGTRQRVTFDEPVYARMWVVVTQAGVSKIRAEIILSDASPVILYKALLSRHDYFHSEWEPGDNNRLRVEMETPVSGEPESFKMWTSNESLVFPPLRGARAGGVNVAVHSPSELPLEADYVLLTTNEAVQDNDGIQVDTRRIEVKIRFSKNALQTLTK